MKIMKQIIPLDDQEYFTLWMTPDEFGMMCKFMRDNGIGYGPSRTITSRWQLARREFDSEKREAKKQ